jgi:hypothetical protein
VPSTATSAHLPDAHGSEGRSDGERERTSDVHHPEILGVAGTVRQHVRHEVILSDSALVQTRARKRNHLRPVSREVRDQYVNTRQPPASTAVQVRGLFRKDALIEVEAVAVVAPTELPGR